MEQSKPGVPPPRVLDAATLKAFAHPLRLRVYDRLEREGPATATQLARQMEENTGVTSYHLRELARHGLIEDAPDRGKGKERWWRTTAGGFSFNPDRFRTDPDTASAAELLLADVYRQRGEELGRWLEQSRSTPSEWIEASTSARRALLLTRDELRDLSRDVERVLAEHIQRAQGRDDEEPEPAGQMRAHVVVHFDAFPVGLDDT